MPETAVFMTPHFVPAVQPESRENTTITDNARSILKAAVHNDLIKRVDLDKLALIQADASGGRQKLLNIILQFVNDQGVPLSGRDRDQVANEVLDEVFGLGPLEPLLHDPGINDILVNTHTTVYVERQGVIEKTNISFRDNAHLMHIIDKIVSAVGRRIDESSPMVDARLLDGSRVNIIVPPLAIDGPLLSIRRFGQSPLTADDLLRRRALIPQMLEILQCAVRARLNIIVSGGTGAGKTTLLNVLSGYISQFERIITIEDSAELQIQQEHVVRLECRPPNLEGRGAIRQRELVMNALRMRPDRIILGEVRGEEALDMLQAMNTGHDGSITTVHANNPRDAIARIETMCMMGNVLLPDKAIRAQIASSINLVIQVSRMSDGSRRVTHISEITGSSGEILSMQDIFLFEKQGLGANGEVRGRFKATGIVPKFAEVARAAGFPLPLNFMDHSVEV
ncbi:CpaF family protein [Granulicella arctica]|uniref:CpaF family protein n=1 Tax=Granulicella arctica TaxID=940613 RepID=UPI0021E012DF|nr:CpaF family protein [Granulicella arctica]